MEEQINNPTFEYFLENFQKDPNIENDSIFDLFLSQIHMHKFDIDREEMTSLLQTISVKGLQKYTKTGKTIALVFLSKHMKIPQELMMHILRNSNLEVRDENEMTIPMMIIQYNHYYCFTADQLFEIFDKSDMNAICTESNSNMCLGSFIATQNKSKKLNLSTEKIMHLFSKSNFKSDLIINILRFNQEENLNIPEKTLMEYIKKAGYSFYSRENNSLAVTVVDNQTRQFNLSNKDMFEILNNCSTTFMHQGTDSLTDVLMDKKSYKQSGLNAEQLFQILLKSDLEQKNKNFGFTIGMELAVNNKRYDINMPSNLLCRIFEKSRIAQKANTSQNLPDLILRHNQEQNLNIEYNQFEKILSKSHMTPSKQLCYLCLYALSNNQEYKLHDIHEQMDLFKSKQFIIDNILDKGHSLDNKGMLERFTIFLETLTLKEEVQTHSVSKKMKTL